MLILFGSRTGNEENNQKDPVDLRYINCDNTNCACGSIPAIKIKYKKNGQLFNFARFAFCASMYRDIPPEPLVIL
jgi:hypothetical protein